MLLRSKRNLYPGVNAHLNSLLQDEAGGWESFHAEQIVQTRILLDKRLPSGYLVLAEKSLQISEMVPPSPPLTKWIRPDVTIYQSPPSPASSAMAAGSHPTPILTMPLEDTLERDEVLRCLIIYQTDLHPVYGKPVTRIEILSPANKEGGSHHSRYLLRH